MRDEESIIKGGGRKLKSEDKMKVWNSKYKGKRTSDDEGKGKWRR